MAPAHDGKDLCGFARRQTDEARREILEHLVLWELQLQAAPTVGSCRDAGVFVRSPQCEMTVAINRIRVLRTGYRFSVRVRRKEREHDGNWKERTS